MKLHLGCGEVYLKGYINVDFPSTKHSVQQKHIADVRKDILGLRYPAESIEEVRLHHVFEHFSRPVALALLAGWRSWLIPGGLLRIEVPDFDKTASRVLNPFTKNKQKYVALRHIFGSQEASWAHHFEGWSAYRLKAVCTNFGFQPNKTMKNSWRGTYNVEIIATKTNQDIGKKEFKNIAQSILTDYLLDNTPSEMRLLRVWMKSYNGQICQTWAR